MDKALSLLVAFVSLIGSYLWGVPGSMIPVALSVSLAILLIWFAQEVGAWAGPTGKSLLNVRFPSRIVRLVGWTVLIITPLVALVLLALES